jgi:peptidoglycan hydrolase-like protein with peptidoglycan-binding domain
MVEYQILKPPPRRHRAAWITLVVLVLVAAGAGAFAAGRHARGVSAAGRGRTTSTSTITPGSLTIVSTTPSNGATDVPSDQVVMVHLSAPVTGTSGLPAFSPPVTGTWTQVGPSTFTFAATAPFIPTSTETLVFPAGTGGPHSRGGAALAAPVTLSFSVAQSSTERLQQLLAQLNYLPLSFTPAGGLASPIEAATSQTGTFNWRWPGTPVTLTSSWTEGSEDVITKAAVMNFENQHGLAVDGLAGRRVWSALLTDVARARVNANPYTYVVVSKQPPEALTLYENGAPVMANIAVNTGAPGADTVDGTYPVFEHVTSSEMKGTNPDGSTYDDPNVPWASYFLGGDALHGFVRATYGSAQSNGCVEMPIAEAAQLWPLTPIGTLVTVVGPAS